MTLLPEAGGIYLVAAFLARPAEIKVRSGRVFQLTAGYYGYAGSARRGLASRLERHLRKNKKLHWHVDFLLTKTNVCAVVHAVTPERLECDFARRLAARLLAVAGFGASDCGCPSHLFYAADAKTLIRTARNAGRELGLTPGVVDYLGFSARPEVKAGPSSDPRP